MPWDGTELKVAGVAPDGAIDPARTVAGNSSDWISQPRWSPDGILHFVAEPTGWMNIYRLADSGPEALAPYEAEFVFPDWNFGYSDFGFAPTARSLRSLEAAVATASTGSARRSRRSQRSRRPSPK